jgi:hypothetical protein
MCYDFRVILCIRLRVGCIHCERQHFKTRRAVRRTETDFLSLSDRFTKKFLSFRRVECISFWSVCITSQLKVEVTIIKTVLQNAISADSALGLNLTNQKNQHKITVLLANKRKYFHIK